MAEDRDRQRPEQNSFPTRNSSPSSELGTPDLSSSSSTTSEHSEPKTLPDSQPLHYSFPQIAASSGPSSRSTTPFSNNENANEDGNGNIRDDVTAAGSLASSDGHAWPFDRSRASTPAINGNEYENGRDDNSSEIGSESNDRRFERSRAPSPDSHIATPREGTPAAESQGTSLDTVDEGAEDEGDREGEEEVGPEVQRDDFDYIETENRDDDGEGAEGGEEREF
ncbi:hypothetical protein N431DRAFT_453916 [Stipitochalara longipes BDJ]|nr:hypothetical protein N431DRAFT_453916 [Stipitochalara longipes BDJ]